MTAYLAYAHAYFVTYPEALQDGIKLGVQGPEEVAQSLSRHLHSRALSAAKTASERSHRSNDSGPLSVGLAVAVVSLVDFINGGLDEVEDFDRDTVRHRLYGVGQLAKHGKRLEERVDVRKRVELWINAFGAGCGKSVSRGGGGGQGRRWRRAESG